MRTRNILSIISIHILVMLVLGIAQAEDQKPNIVLILTDDQGWGDLSISGNTNLSTPKIDSLAHAGASMDNFFVCAVCSPTRAELLTGRYSTRVGVTSTSRGGERLNLDETTMADTFQAAGYATGAFGKWHNGSQWPYHPNARGFDEFYGFCSGHWGLYFDPALEHNNRQVKGRGFIADDCTDQAMKFIEANQDKPFLCYIPYCTPHAPMQVPDKYWDIHAKAELKMRAREDQEEDLEFTRAALAMCENIDWNVGRVLDQLDALGLSDNTIVIFMTDNGPNGYRWNGGMKGRKGSTDEGGVRVPFFIRWPGTIKAGTKVPQIGGAIDLLPTLADLTGVPLTSKKKLDGVSLKPLLLGTAKEWPDRFYFNAWKKSVSVRSQKYRLDNKCKLFDMESDHGQTKDISAEHPEITAEHKQALVEWRQDAGKKSKQKKVPFTVGHPGDPVTVLPARDGAGSGAIKRSSPHPNCSFFTNWTKTKDTINWDIEVLTSGKYKAQIYYTCKQENVGVELELSFYGSKTTGVVIEAHDPPLKGKAENRVPGSESYVKEFKALSLGVLDLANKTDKLTLKATKIPGDAAIEVRQIILTRVDK